MHYAKKDADVTLAMHRMQWAPDKLILEQLKSREGTPFEVDVGPSAYVSASSEPWKPSLQPG